MNATSIPELPTVPAGAWQKWIMFATAGAVGIMFTVSLWLFLKANDRPEAVVSTQENSAAPAVPESLAEQDDTEPTPAKRDDEPRPTATDETLAKPAPAVEVTEIDEPATDPAAADANSSSEKLAANEQSQPEPDPPKGDEPSVATDSADEPTVLDSARGGPEEYPIPEPNPDIGARLQTQLDGAKLTGMQLASALHVLSQLIAVPIQLDRGALSRVGIDDRAVVGAAAENVTPNDLLQVMLARWGLTHVATGDQVIITAIGSDAAPRRSIRYRVDDLAVGASEMQRLAGVVQQLATPNSWQAAGGPGTLAVEGNSLVVSQTPPVHYEILVLCEKLRVARGLSPRSKYDPNRFRLTTRTEAAQQLLQRPVSCGSAGDLSLSEYLSRLAHRGDATFAVDTLGLVHAGISPQAAVTAGDDEKPLGELITEAIEPVGLAWRVLNPTLVEVTTPRVIAQTPDIEFYRVTDLAPRETDARALVDRILREVAPSNWAAVGGDGQLHYDADSQCLIVRQPQPIQRLLAAQLANWEKE
jgi:hypothetical protein